jgi:hypothetical protein
MEATAAIAVLERVVTEEKEEMGCSGAVMAAMVENLNRVGEAMVGKVDLASFEEALAAMEGITK